MRCPFGMADWLNRLWAFIIYTVFLIKKKKCKNKYIYIKVIIGILSCIVSIVSFMVYQKQITASRGSNTEPGITKLVAPFHHSHRIVDSSRQSSPGVSPKDCFKYGKFWGVDNFSYKLISVKRNVHQDIWHQEGSVNNKNTTPCLHALQQRVCTVN